MKGFVDDIEDLTEDNSDFRRVIYTGKYLQLVLMSLNPGEEIGDEVHHDRDQFFRVEGGKGEVWVDGARTSCTRCTDPRSTKTRPCTRQRTMHEGPKSTSTAQRRNDSAWA